MKTISLTAENVKKIQTEPPKLPPPQVAMLRFVDAGVVNFTHISGGVITVQGCVVTSKARPVLRALGRKGLIKMPRRAVYSGRYGGLVTITPAGRRALEQVDATGEVGIVMGDGLATAAKGEAA